MTISLPTPISPETAEFDAVTAELRAAVEPDFLALLGWDPQMRLLYFPHDHPYLGVKACIVPGCYRASTYACGLCSGCRSRWKRRWQHLSPQEFAVSSAAQAGRYLGIGKCVIVDCPRPWKTAQVRLCAAHEYQRTVTLKLTMAEFLLHPDVRALPSYGLCQIAACVRQRPGKTSPYCEAHKCRLRELRRRVRDFDEEHWRRTATPIDEGNEVSLRGLTDRVVAEVLYGLQERIRDCVRTPYYKLRPFCDLLRRWQVSSVEELELTEQSSGLHRQLRDAFVRYANRRGLSPESERHKDLWDLQVFGHTKWLRFVGITQPWLRQAAKMWAWDDLPRRRGDNVADAVQSHVNALEKLSESLRLQRPDHGDHPAALGRGDIVAFGNRLAFLEQRGDITLRRRNSICTYVRRVLIRMRTMGLARPGQPLHRLPDDFAMGLEDVPALPDEDEAGQDLPAEVMEVLCANLPQLEEEHNREARLAIELLIDTGRRPVEICKLAWDCLQRDGDGKPVLIYDNYKSHRYGRRLPIPEATAGLITEQQERVRAQYPNTPQNRLKLLPTTYRCVDGTRPISTAWVSGRHRMWVDALPDIHVAAKIEIEGQPVTKMLPFDKTKIFPYAYRHTYAQRHADAGVPVDVLQQLMDHEQSATTQQYYRVGEQRRREAIERVTQMQFDRHGNRIWRQAKVLLDTEHLRRAVGEVAVPYGVCSEPSNVAANGQDCPVRFRCVGCGHFRTDVSYLPDLETYLADLLRNRERLLAAIDADDWAKAEALPSDEEISRVRRLIRRVKDSVDELTDEERAEIDQATTLVRRARNSVVHLGLPRIRQPLPDIRPNRTA